MRRAALLMVMTLMGCEGSVAPTVTGPTAPPTPSPILVPTASPSLVPTASPSPTASPTPVQPPSSEPGSTPRERPSLTPGELDDEAAAGLAAFFTDNYHGFMATGDKDLLEPLFRYPQGAIFINESARGVWEGSLDVDLEYEVGAPTIYNNEGTFFSFRTPVQVMSYVVRDAASGEVTDRFPDALIEFSGTIGMVEGTWRLMQHSWEYQNEPGRVPDHGRARGSPG